MSRPSATPISPSPRRRWLPVIVAAAVAVPGTLAVLVAKPASAVTTRYEAESAPATCTGTIDANHAGFSGSGFCNADNATGASATFTVTAPSAGAATIGLRYANGTTTNRTANLIINGATVQSIPFAGTGAWTAWATTTVTVTLIAGSNTITLSPTTSNGLPNIDYIDVETAAPPTSGTVRYEAENAPATCAGTIDANHAGFSGSGFCNGDNATGATASFTVTGTGGTATVGIRYANGSGSNRTANLVVNGSTVQSLPFADTGGWSAWTTTSVSVTLNAGNNTVTLNPTTSSGLANIDYVEVTGAGTPPPTTPPPSGDGTYQMEALDRGVVSVRSGDGNFVSWRLLGTDPQNVAFNVYRGSTLVNSSPITNSTNLYDGGAASGASYTVRAVVNGTEQAASPASLQFNSSGYMDVPIQAPGTGYTASDGSVGDLDGDGQLEIVLKWDGPETRDNSQAGITSLVYVDAYELNGARLWRINLGRNIRAGAHYTQFQVYDYDGDGRAEVAMKTADATVSGTGQVIGNANADHRNADGYILTGPEFLTIFDGQTGAILDTVNYQPPRGTVSAWGDSYGNRVDRFLAGTAYLDGERPSMIFARGYYTRSVIWAVDYRNGELTTRWLFDSNTAGSQWTGQGNHNLSIADVDNDGRDEIVYGSMVVNDNGTGLWTSGRGHGDALHVGDFLNNGSLYIWQIHESGNIGAGLYSGTGQQQFNKPNNSGGEGPGRGVAGDIYAGSAGAEYWASLGGGVSGLFNSTGTNIGRVPSSANFLAWWDADPVRELLDDTHIDKYGTSSDTRLLTGSSVASNNGTKATPVLSGDLFGDWREEVIWRTTSGTALRIYTSSAVTDRRIPTLLHDPMYRVAIAWQNTAYNQPPHPSFFIGNGMPVPPWPDIYTP